MPVAQHLEYAGVGRETGLALAHGRQPQAHEQDVGQLLRGADVELAAGELVDAVAQLVDGVAHASRDLAQPVGVHLDTRGFHLCQHTHERQLDLTQEPAQLEVFETNGLLVSHPPGQHGARSSVSLALGAVDHLGLLDAGQLEEAHLRQLRAKQIGRDGRVESRPGRRLREARVRLGVMGDDVLCQQPETGPLLFAHSRCLHGLATGVDGGDPGRFLDVAGRRLFVRVGSREGQRGLLLLQDRRQRPEAVLDDQPRHVDHRRCRR